MNEYIRHKKDMEAYHMMYTEMLMVVYNNIMNKGDYCYCLHKYMSEKNIYCKRKLEKHWESIYWLMNDAKDSLCFQILKIDKIQNSKIINSILKKFNSDSKFTKFFRNYADECQQTKSQE